MNSVYGYVRVSSVDQNESRQLAAMQQSGVPMAAGLHVRGVVMLQGETQPLA